MIDSNNLSNTNPLLIKFVSAKISSSFAVRYLISNVPLLNGFVESYTLPSYGNDMICVGN